MNSINWELNFLEHLAHVKNSSYDRIDRTGTGTRSSFGKMLTIDLRDGFPLMTTKKVPFKSVLSELLWFIEGSMDERRLAEIRYGKPREELTDKTTIWTANAQAPYWVNKGLKFSEGDCGPIYGAQWRSWMNEDGLAVDQLKNLIDGLIADPTGRRHILSAWNPAEIDKMALPPCHVLSQYYVSEGRLHCLLYQRSCDLFLGSPFNIASYAILTHMLAQICNYEIGSLVYMMGDNHIYLNHLEQVEELLSRTPYLPPTLQLDPTIKDIDKFNMDSFNLINYTSHPTLSAPMAV